jgi:hypothetical protein
MPLHRRKSNFLQSLTLLVYRKLTWHSDTLNILELPKALFNVLPNVRWPSSAGALGLLADVFRRMSSVLPRVLAFWF